MVVTQGGQGPGTRVRRSEGDAATGGETAGDRGAGGRVLAHRQEAASGWLEGT